MFNPQHHISQAWKFYPLGSRTGRSEVYGHPQPHSKFEANLECRSRGGMGQCLGDGENGGLRDRRIEASAICRTSHRGLERGRRGLEWVL